MGGTAAKLAGATGSGFWSFLDGYLADDSGRAQPPEAKRPVFGEKDPNGDMAAPTGMPVPAAATAPLAPFWGLEQLEGSGTTTVASARDVTAVGGQDFSTGSDSALEPAVLPQGTGMAGPWAWDAGLPQDDLAVKTDPAKGPRAATPALDATPELAFGVRLLPEPATATMGAADALPSSPPAVNSAYAGLGVGLEDRSMTAEDEHAQPKNTEPSGTSRDTHTALLDDGQSDSQNMAIPGNARSSSGTPLDSGQSGSRNTAIPANPHGASTAQEEGRTALSTEQRNAGSLASTSPQSAALSSQHTAGDGGGNATARHADLESVGNAATPALADRDAQTAVPARQAATAYPAEFPEPTPQPVSRDVSLHLADGESRVDIRMAERAGEIRVTVHTPDHDLANSLRADLPDLVGKLRQSGFQAEAWRPAAATQPDAGRRNASDAPPSQEHSPGARRDGRQQQPQQQQAKNQSRWAGEWKSSLDPAQEPLI